LVTKSSVESQLTEESTVDGTSRARQRRARETYMSLITQNLGTAPAGDPRVLGRTMRHLIGYRAAVQSLSAARIQRTFRDHSFPLQVTPRDLSWCCALVPRCPVLPLFLLLPLFPSPPRSLLSPSLPLTISLCFMCTSLVSDV
jgi:hypothetical protein